MNFICKEEFEAIRTSVNCGRVIPQIPQIYLRGDVSMSCLVSMFADRDLN